MPWFPANHRRNAHLDAIGRRQAKSADIAAIPARTDAPNRPGIPGNQDRTPAFGRCRTFARPALPTAFSSRPLLAFLHFAPFIPARTIRQARVLTTAASPTFYLRTSRDCG